MSFRFHVRATALTVALLSLGVILATAPLRAEEAAAPGEALYRSRCAFCHEGGVARAPDLSALRQLAPGRLDFALAFGMMSQQGRELSQAQIADIVGYLKGTAPQPQPVLPDSSCHDAGPALNDATLPRWNGWGVDIRQHRFQPADQAQLAADDVPRLKLRWAFAFPGDIKAYAQPTVYGDGYSSAAPAARSMRSMPKPAASAGCSTQASACAAPSPSARTRAG